jgi:pilus assembly protein Flp/PilA
MRMKLFHKLVSLAYSRSGATAVEYCLIAGIISIAIVGGATVMGSSANDSFQAANAGFN